MKRILPAVLIVLVAGIFAFTEKSEPSTSTPPPYRARNLLTGKTTPTSGLTTTLARRFTVPHFGMRHRLATPISWTWAYTFTTADFYDADDTLFPSGLKGPVRIIAYQEPTIAPASAPKND